MGIKRYLIALFGDYCAGFQWHCRKPILLYRSGIIGRVNFRRDVRRILLIQTKTHQSLFIYEHEDEGDDDNPHHGKPCTFDGWHTVWLLIHLIAVIAVTKMMPARWALLTSMNAPVAFTGFLVALLILAGRTAGALGGTRIIRFRRAASLFFGSVLATISLTVPVVTLAGRR